MKKGDLVRAKASEFDEWNRLPKGFRSTTEEEQERWHAELRNGVPKCVYLACPKTGEQFYMHRHEVEVVSER